MTQFCLLWDTSQPDAVRRWDTSEEELEGIVALFLERKESKEEVMPSLKGVPYFSVLSIQLVSHHCRATMSALVNWVWRTHTCPWLFFLFDSPDFFRIRYDTELTWRMPLLFTNLQYSYSRLKEQSSPWVFRERNVLERNAYKSSV